MHRILIIGTFVVSFAVGALAAEVGISQKGRKFSEKKITLNAGDSLKFINDDDITHNVHSVTKGHEFDVGAQDPGKSVSHTFAKAGKVKVRCAIHPKMKMTVTVN